MCGIFLAITMSDSINEWSVLFGRGGKANSFIGCVRFRAMVVQAQAEYLAARKKDKTLIAQRIVKAIQANGGLFLTRMSASNKDEWVEVSDDRAIAKTSQALREGLDVRRKKFRPGKIFKHIEDDADSVKRCQIKGKVIKTLPARDVSPDHTPVNSPLGPRPMDVPSHVSILALDSMDLPDMSDDSDDYCLDVLPRFYELQHVFDL